MQCPGWTSLTFLVLLNAVFLHGLANESSVCDVLDDLI